MSRDFNVSEFKSALQYGGARNTLFSIQLIPPPGLARLSAQLTTIPLLARAAAIPESNLGLIPVPYFGRTVKIAGDRTFQPWEVTIINDEDFALRNALEDWSNSINQMRGNVRLGDAANLSYKANANVTQYSKTGETLRTYSFEGLYPATVFGIDLAWNQVDTIEEFRVSFEYDEWTVVDGATGTPGNQG